MQAYGEQCQTGEVHPQGRRYGFMQGISIKAVLLATLAVFGIDFVSSLVLFAMFDGPPLDAPPEQIRAALDALNADAGYLLTALVLGTASTVVGGYLLRVWLRRCRTTTPWHSALSVSLSASRFPRDCRPGSGSWDWVLVSRQRSPGPT